MGTVTLSILALAVMSATPALGASDAGTPSAQPNLKAGGAFYTEAVIARARANVAVHDWAAEAQAAAVERARPWLEASDDELWEMVFGPHIKRSWMVWSNGFCPACKAEVKMYNWLMDPWAHRWKVQCPHCEARFPTNDFGAFHRSGLDEHGVFRPKLANRSLLFNADHPAPDDPLRLFGVDDGEGYVDEEENRWRFIGAYLIYGQWKKLIVNGIVNLSAAYVATGDSRYAYKAALMFDRVADVFPSFDFKEQGIVYERQGDRGQVSTWHDACQEIHRLALAYDRVFEGARGQEEALVAYLSKRAEQYRLGNPKRTWTDIQRNIEERIFRDTLANGERIRSNYPTTDVALLLIKTVLDWPGNRDEVVSLLDGMLDKATAVDGVSGEKGMAGYATIAPRTVAQVLAQFSLLEDDFLQAVYERHPALHQTYRFHVDMRCLDEYYPRSGDTGRFGAKEAAYGGVSLAQKVTADPSMWTFLLDMYRLTQDPALAQVVYNANGNTVDNLPYDLFAENPAAVQAEVQAIIDEAGPSIQRTSIDKQQWRLAILRSGAGEHRRALWMDYDSHGAHSHADGLNLGLFGKGLDLMPDFGYPPVGYGGWRAPKARWYTMTAAHNTVVVDGKNQQGADGAMTLWAPGERVHAMRASSPEMYGVARYERTAVLVDIDDEDYYVIDVFAVEGGQDHALFFHSYFGSVELTGLDPAPFPEYGHEADMRDFKGQRHVEPGWNADWRLDNYHDYIPEGQDVHMRYTGLTAGVDVALAEAWIDASGWQGTQEWIPRLMVRRTASEESLASVFVSVIEPYVGQRTLDGISRLTLQAVDGQALPDSCVGLQVDRADGRYDVCLMAPGGHGAAMLEPKHDIELNGELGVVTFGPSGVERVMLAKAKFMRVGTLEITLASETEHVELIFPEDGAKQVGGATGVVERVSIGDVGVALR